MHAPAALTALRAILRTRFSETALDDADLGEASADELTAAASRLGVVYPVCEALDAAKLAGVRVAELRESLKPYRLRALALSVKLFEDGKIVVNALREGGVDHIPFKGPFLSLDLFGNPDARTSSDIDIILPGGRPDIDRAVAALEGVGYRRPEVSDVVAEYYARECREFTLHSGTRTPVDLHYGSYPDLPESAFAAAAARAVEVEHEGLRRRAFAGADLLAILSTHFWGVARGMRLKWLLDIAALVAREDTFAGDWLERVLQWRAQVLVASAIEAARHDLGAAPPEAELRRLLGALTARERTAARRVADVGCEGVRFGYVQRIHRLGLPVKARFRAVKKYLFPHPGRIALDAGRPTWSPGLLDRAGHAVSRLVAALCAGS